MRRSYVTPVVGGNDTPIASTPEPASMLIFGIGAMGMGAVAIRRRIKK